ncbi:MAG: aldehyde dehydrogenase family protein, partial [Bacteroidota bacterium]
MFGNQILGSVSYQGIRHFSSFNPKENQVNSEQFLCASDEEIEIALSSAKISFESFAQSTPQKRSLLLLQIVDELCEIQENIKHIYCKESGLST